MKVSMFRAYLRPIAAVATLTALAAYAVIMLRGPQGLTALSDRQKQIRALEEENANLAREVETRKQHIKRLESDPATQVLELRKAGFVGEGDTQFNSGGQKISPSTYGTSTDTSTPASH
jgi:cell division protein FtsB